MSSRRRAEAHPDGGTVELRFSIVIPAFGEERRIGPSLARLLEAAPDLGLHEIIVVDDASPDATAAIALGYAQAGDTPSAEELPVHVLAHGENRGKGAALRTGAAAATGDAIAFFDADLSVDPAALIEARRALDEGADLVCGTRVSPDGQSLRENQPLRRAAGSRVFRWLQRAIVGLPFADTQCPFKVLRAEAAREVLARCKADRWALDVELLLVAQQRGLRIVELPVRYRHVDGSTVGLASALIDTPRELLAIRRRHGSARSDKARSPSPGNRAPSEPRR